MNIDKILGSGLTGIFYQVTWLGDKYAKYKFLNRSLVLDEAYALGRLNHPHIVQMLAYSEESLLMEFMPTNLKAYIRTRVKEGAKQPFSLRAAIDLMLQVAGGMRYLHSQNIAHWDLKSSNVLVRPVDVPGLGEEGFVHAKVADFCISKTIQEISSYPHWTTNIGTMSWRAPETFTDCDNDIQLMQALTMSDDVHSFGIVCSEILSGGRRFRQSSRFLKRLIAKPGPLRLPRPPTCPKNLAALIKRCCDTDPLRRPAFTDICIMLRYLKGQLMSGKYWFEAILD